MMCLLDSSSPLPILLLTILTVATASSDIAQQDLPINCSSTISTPAFSGPSSSQTQAYQLISSTLKPGARCSIVLDGRGYTINATAHITTPSKNSTFVFVQVQEGQTTIYGLNTLVGVISNKLFLSVTRSLLDADDSSFGLRITIDWYKYTCQGARSIELTPEKPWLVLDAGSMPGVATIIRVPAGDRLHILPLDISTFDSDANFAMIILRGGTFNSSTIANFSLDTSYPSWYTVQARPYRTTGTELPKSDNDVYTAFIDGRYRNSRLQVVFILESAFGGSAASYQSALYRLASTSIGGPGNITISGSQTALVYVDPGDAFVYVKSIDTTESLTVLAGGPRGANVSDYTIFTTSSSDGSLWEGTQLRGRLLTFVGRNFSATLSVTSQFNQSYLTQLGRNCKGVFMSDRLGIWGPDALPSTYYNAKPDSSGNYIDDQTEVYAANSERYVWTYDIVLADLAASGNLSETIQMRVLDTNSSASDFVSHAAVHGRQRSIKGRGLSLAFNTTKQDSRGYLVRWVGKSSGRTAIFVLQALIPLLVTVAFAL